MTPGTTLKNFLSFQLSEWECIFEIMIPQTYIPPIGGFCHFMLFHIPYGFSRATWEPEMIMLANFIPK